MKYSLSDIARIYSGGTPSSTNPEYWNGGIPWLSSGETNFSFINSTNKTITKLGVEKSSTRLAKKESTVVASAGQGHTRGQTSYLMIDTYVNQSLLVFEPIKEMIEPLFLFYNLKNRYEEFRLLSDGTSTRGGLSGWIVKKMEIDLPSLDVQKKIVSILFSIDNKIELNNKINDNLQQQAQAIYLETIPYSVDDNLPDGWKIGKVEEVIELFDSKRIPLSGKDRAKMENKKYPYYGAASLMDYVNDYIFDGKYLLLGEDGTVVDSKGYPILQYVWGKFWVNNHAHIMQGRNGFNVESLFLLFKNTPVQSIVTGAVQPKINQANLNSINIVIPPKTIMDELNFRIESLFSLIREIHEENEKLSNLRDILLPKLMNGEIDVSNIKLDL